MLVEKDEADQRMNYYRLTSPKPHEIKRVGIEKNSIFLRLLSHTKDSVDYLFSVEYAKLDLSNERENNEECV